MDINEVGTLLYWCEGSKREEDYRVEFVNSDPKMVAVFMKYIRAKGVDEKRLRLRLAIHIQDDETECKKYWIELTGLNDSNFMSTIVKKRSSWKKHLPYGTLTIRYNSISLLREIKAEISSMAERLSQ
jgi:hypothetical protein